MADEAETGRPSPRRKRKAAEPVTEWELRLYVAGQSKRSLEAVTNLKKLCEEHLKGRYHIDIVDLLVNPRLARDDEILAVPTLVRRIPTPLRKIIGDLSNTDRVLVGLQLRPARVDKRLGQEQESA